MPWLTLSGSNYPRLERISMVLNMFEPLKFDCRYVFVMIVWMWVVVDRSQVIILVLLLLVSSFCFRWGAVFLILCHSTFPQCLGGDAFRECSLPSWINVYLFVIPLRKHAYLNKMTILPPKNENFQIKFWYFSHISAQNIDCGEAVLTSTHNLCFRTEIRKIMCTPVNPSFTT